MPRYQARGSSSCDTLLCCHPERSEGPCVCSSKGAERRNRLAQPVRAGLGCLFTQEPAKRATQKMPKHRPQPAAILTISDSVSKKKRQDLSGPALKEVLKANGYAVVTIKVVPDEKSKISAALKQLAKK